MIWFFRDSFYWEEDDANEENYQVKYASCILIHAYILRLIFQATVAQLEQRYILAPYYALDAYLVSSGKNTILVDLKTVIWTEEQLEESKWFIIGMVCIYIYMVGKFWNDGFLELSKMQSRKYMSTLKDNWSDWSWSNDCPNTHHYAF